MLSVSVIIPLYNAEKFISKALDSCLNLKEVREIIVIDDGHKDNAQKIVQEYIHNFSFIKLLQHPNRENKGASASRNLGIRHATQEFIAFLDADDFYLPNRFIKDKRVFSDYPDADGCYNALGVYFYSEEAKSQFEKHFKNRKITTVSAEKNPTPDNLLAGLSKLIKGYGYFSLDCLTVKKESLLKHNLFFNEDLQMHEDTEFLIKLAYYCKIFPSEINVATAKRGVHKENRITTNFDRQFSLRNNNRYLQWKALYDWSRNQRFNDPKVIIHFKERYDYYRLTKISSPSFKLLILELIKNPSLLKNPQYRNIHNLYMKKTGRIIRHILLKIRNLLIKIL